MAASVLASSIMLIESSLLGLTPLLFAKTQVLPRISYVIGCRAVREVGILLSHLFDCQDSPYGAAVTLPFLWIVMCRHGMRMVTLKAMAIDPFL
jgi:hypothetical protein